MKIMTFNIQHCNNFLENKIDYDIIAQAIKRVDPDVVTLNEVRDAGEREGYEAQTDILSKLCGMEYKYFAKAIDVYDVSSPYGNSILSKNKILTAKTIPIPDPTVRNGSRKYESRCILKAKLDCGLTVLAVHVGLNAEEQELAVETVLKNLEDEKCVLLGDFNMHPDNERLLPILDKMNDAAEKLSCRKLSFPSDKPTIKIDYIFATPDIEIISADIPEIVASDHRPHVCDISFS